MSESTARNSVLIFGATGGIGSALARQLAAGGANLFLSGRDEVRLAALAGETGAAALAADATNSAEIESVFTASKERLGRLDGVASCVGTLLLKPAHLMTDEEWSRTLAANLTTSFNILRGSAQWMMRQGGGGAIVFCSSVAGSLGLPNHEAISAAKAGVEGLVRAAAATYANKQVRVNAVAPGLTLTPLSARLTAAEPSRRASEAMHPLGRLGQPEDVAAALAFLLDSRSCWITGHILAVDGGLGSVRAR